MRSALRIAGIVCLLLSTACLAGSAVPAQPLLKKVGAVFNHAMDATFGHLFRRHGKHRALLGEGPTEVTANGGLDVGLHKQTLASSQSTSGASMNVSIDRRTDQSSMTVQLPIAYANGQSAVGQILAGYSTPKYSISYGSVAGPADSQLSVAGFTRGLDFSLPKRRGTLDLLAAVGTFEGGVGYHALGVRRTLPIRLGVLELTALHAFGEGGGEGTSVFDASLIRSSGRTTEFYELGYGMGNTGSGEHGAFAWSGADRPRRTVGLQLALRARDAGDVRDDRRLGYRHAPHRRHCQPAARDRRAVERRSRARDGRDRPRT